MDNDARVLMLYTGGTIGMLKTAEGGYAPHPGFLTSNLRAQARFHDPLEESLFAHSASASAFSSWTRSGGGSGTSSPKPNAADTQLPVTLPVRVNGKDVHLPSLVTPRFAQGRRVRYAVLEYETLIDSSEIEPKDWIRIAADIEANYERFDGFMILHGTDTMAYSASALSFLLEGLGKTVILTGAQIPLSELFNDAIDNLLGSLIIAGHYTIPEVCLFFNHQLFRGNRTLKSSSDDFEAFSSPSLPALATVGIDIDVAWPAILRPGTTAFRAHKTLADGVATLRLFPGISIEGVKAFFDSPNIRGVVLETYGAGNAPRKADLLRVFKEATDRGVVIVNVSQCTSGSVAQGIYETGRALSAAGIVAGADMTTECALAKLAYLLSKPNLSPDQVRKLIGNPLRGELTVASPSPSIAPSSPLDSLRNVFAQVRELQLAKERQRPRRISTTDPSASITLTSSHETSQWPLNAQEANEIQESILPFLVCSAAGESGPRLGMLLASAPVELLSRVINESISSSLYTPLHLAVLADSTQNVELLLANGASVHARDHASHSVLFHAANQGSAEIVKLLRDVGAHLSDIEIERGDVGFAITKGDEVVKQVWKKAAGTRYEAAVRALRQLGLQVAQQAA